MSDEEEEEDPDANLIPNVKPGAFLGAYEVNDLAEVGISIVKDKSIDLLKEFIVTVNRADKSTGPPLANLCDFELQTPLHYACGKTGSVIKTKMLLDGYSDWRFENEFGLNAVHNTSMHVYILYEYELRIILNNITPYIFNFYSYYF